MQTQQTLKPAARFCAVYRTGGTVNFKWTRTTSMTREEADKAREEISRMGYRCMVVDAAQSAAIGLPTTFSA